MRVLPIIASVLFLGLTAAYGQEVSDAAAWTGRLRSTSNVERRVAQAYLARMGPPALPILERLAESNDRSLRKALREIVGIALLKSVQPDELSKYAALQGLCKADVRRARQLAKPLAGAKEHDSGELGFTGAPFGAPPPPLSPVRKIIADLTAMDGVAVPAALDLCADSSPVSRLYGAEILTRIGAISQRPILDQLKTDPARVVIFHGDYHDGSSVGAEAAGYLKSYPYAPPPRPSYRSAFEAEQYLILLDTWQRGAHPNLDRFRADICNAVRQDGPALEATTWDDYWRRARPVLERFWGNR